GPGESTRGRGGVRELASAGKGPAGDIGAGLRPAIGASFGRLDLLKTGDKPAVIAHDWLGKTELPSNRVVAVWDLPSLLTATAKQKLDEPAHEALTNNCEVAADRLKRCLAVAHFAIRAGLRELPNAKDVPRPAHRVRRPVSENLPSPRPICSGVVPTGSRRMPPWVERPTVTIDLARVRRGEPPDLPPEAVAASQALLGEVMATVPKKARLLAYLLAIRTGNRFGPEFKAAARLIHGDPRDIALANLSYDLVVGALGCSTVVLTTPDGPVIARNMDWWPEGPLAKASY